MKKALYSILAFAFVLTATSCSDDDDNSSGTTAEEVTSTITSGSWRITTFSEDGVDETTNFTGYNFVFGESNTITADNGTNTYTGAWAVTDDDSDDDNPSGDVDLDIIFSNPENFIDLSEDWDVIERTSSKVRLRHVSGGDGGTDYLTFERNDT